MIISNFTRGLAALMFIGANLMSCQSSLTIEEELLDKKTIFIEIEVDQLLESAVPGDEVPDFVKMYSGRINYATRQNGEANLTTEVTPGDEIVWELGEMESVTILSFDFQVVEGEDFLAQSGGSYPEQQADGSWKARASADAQEGALMKYAIHFEVEGQGTYWWDPYIRTSGDLEH